MKEIKELFMRIGIAFLLFLMPFNIFYILFAKITLFGSLPFLSLLGYTFNVDGYILTVGVKDLEFVPACVATSAYYLLASLILLTKGIDLKRRFYLFLTGSFLIFVANIARIDILLFFLIEFGQNWFERVHLFFWHFVSSVYVAAVWIFLTYKFRIKAIPVYSDFKFLLSKSVFKKKKRR